jgi:hypothetical protein
MKHLPSPYKQDPEGPMTLHELSLFAIDVEAVAMGLEILIGEINSEPSPAANAANCMASILVGMAGQLAGMIDEADMAAKRLQ